MVTTPRPEFRICETCIRGGGGTRLGIGNSWLPEWNERAVVIRLGIHTNGIYDYRKCLLLSVTSRKLDRFPENLATCYTIRFVVYFILCILSSCDVTNEGFIKNYRLDNLFFSFLRTLWGALSLFLFSLKIETFRV